MRKTLIALAVTTGLLGLGSAGASALTIGPANGSNQLTAEADSAIQKADWYCGPRCEYRRHRQLQERRWEQSQRWRDHNYGHNHYGYNGAYGYRYR
jgi:hypothetical protein